MPTKKSSVDAADSRHLKNIREMLEKEHGRTFSDGEVESVSQFIHAMAKMTVESTMEEGRRHAKLKDYPKGYHFDENGYSCVICGQLASGEDSWYDSNGLKCMCCQEAINKRIIPVSIIKNKDSYYTSTDLEITFNLTPKIIRSWIKEGIIKDRIVPGKGGKGRHLQIFLLKDNKGFFPPPKKLNIGGPVKELRPDGQEEYVFYPWYYFVNPVEYLKKYGISRYMKFIPIEKNENAG